MSIAEYIRPECILLNQAGGSKREVFEMLAGSLVGASLLDKAGADVLVRKLEEREKLSTTGVGEGVAIPHASLEGFNETVIVIGLFPQGVDFASVDSQPVKVVFMIIGSQSVPRLHIQILARIVRLCRNKELMNKLQSSAAPDEVLASIKEVDV
ncbi:MAG: PTS sugar transporter subunit IIA [Nitrospinae bacterium]|nr:PTS sugar transporter subunit IIA [Nitrospinota bacterium]